MNKLILRLIVLPFIFFYSPLTLVLAGQKLCLDTLKEYSTPVDSNAKEDDVEQKFKTESSAYFNSLDSDKKNEIINIINKIKESTSPLVNIIQPAIIEPAKNNPQPNNFSNSKPILLVHGIVDGLPSQEFPADMPWEWIKPFEALLKKQQLSYFLKWRKSDSFDDNTKLITSSVLKILNDHKDKNLSVVAYSAGGVIALMALKNQLNSSSLSEKQTPNANPKESPAISVNNEQNPFKRVSLYTIASPFFGYRIPSIAKIASIFVGGTTIGLGQGIFKIDEPPPIVQSTNCKHYVNTNCKLDKHSCFNNEISPELGSIHKPFENLPCGSENTFCYATQNHDSILNMALDNILKEHEGLPTNKTQGTNIKALRSKLH